MPLPIARILWAGNNTQHNDHLHVEGDPTFTGYPPTSNPGTSDSVQAVIAAMEEGYGTGYYFTDTPPAEPNWSHMGIYNRRPIAGTSKWSQHSWSNAIDIGPLYGVAEQREYYDYLITYEEDDMPTADEIRAIVREELDRTAAGKVATKFSFWGIKEAIFSGIIGNTKLSAAQVWDETVKTVRRIENKLDA